jgi:hypothetical protein
MTTEPLLVHLRHQLDADCVAEALAGHSPTVAEATGGWEVHVPIGTRIGEILTALQACLIENNIRVVRLTLDGKTYAMEPYDVEAKK